MCSRGEFRPRHASVPTRQHQDHRDPPSWAVGHDPASSADVVFVQFPEIGILDATGVWLKAYVLDGIQYILSLSGPNTESIIINLSYGPTTGPHDGTALLEDALSALVTQFNGTPNHPTLEDLFGGRQFLSDRGTRHFPKVMKERLARSNGSGAFLPTIPYYASPRSG